MTGRWRHKLAVVPASIATLLASHTGTAAAAQHSARPANLVVSSLIIEGLGHNPYLVVPHSGRVPNIRVKVVTRNIGHSPSPPSDTDVFLLGKPRRTHYAYPDVLQIPALAPGEKATRTATLFRVEPHLGLVHVEADADVTDNVNGSEGDNRRTSPEIPVIARTWDVSSLTAETFGSAPQGIDEHAELGFFFRFQRLDVGTGRFIYSATGAIDASGTSPELALLGCTGTGSGSTGHAPWPIATSYFAISFGVDQYYGAIEAANEKGFKVTLTCPEGTRDETFNFLNLRIGSATGPVSLYPPSTKINDSAEGSGPGGGINYGWSLRADVP